MGSLVEFHLVFYGVVAELVEEDVAAMVGVYFVEGFSGVGHSQSPLPQQGSCILELSSRHPPVPACVYLFEHEPVVGVFLQVFQKVFELTPRHVVIPVFGLCLQGGLGSCEGSDQDGFEFEELGQLDDIPDSLVDLCQAENAVAVDIEEGPVLLGIDWVEAELPESNF